MRSDSKNAEAVRVAFRKGYRVLDDGSVESPHGRVRKTIVRRSRRNGTYAYVTLKVPGWANVCQLKIHQLAAYQKFGDAVFEHDCIRHLDEDGLNNAPANIALGSHSDNSLDRPPEERKRHADVASAANHAYRADWPQIDVDRAAGASYKDLRRKYGVPLGTLSYRYSTVAKRRRNVGSC